MFFVVFCSYFHSFMNISQLNHEYGSMSVEKKDTAAFV